MPRGRVLRLVVFVALVWGMGQVDRLLAEPWQADKIAPKDGGGLIVIERYWYEPVPGGYMEPQFRHEIEVKRETGVTHLRSFAWGDCEKIFWGMLSKVDPATNRRLVVEVPDKVFYVILVEKDFRPTLDTVRYIASELGMEIQQEPRKLWGYRLVKNQEEARNLVPYHGIARWPELEPLFHNPEAKFPVVYKGRVCARYELEEGGRRYAGVRLSHEEVHYFEDVSMGELVAHLEQNGMVPYVDQTNEDRRFSFTLPEDVAKQISVDKPFPLPGLGISVVPGEAEFRAFVVKLKDRKKAEPQGPKSEGTKPVQQWTG